MLRPVQKIAPLLFCSGACALLYQTVWLRELRLVFGASTAASAAVLAMFMGGLGAGGLVLGKRIDGKRDPLMWYANLELGVSVLAALTPLLVDASRYVYSALGGTITMGMGLGTVFRLLLSAIVLVPVTFLMGGTLPAAAKAAETDDDLGRGNLALLYGVNTLGAVVGVLASTFLLLEVFGGRLLLWMCCLANALLGVVARGIARGLEADEDARAREKAPAKAPRATEEGEQAPSGDAAAAARQATTDEQAPSTDEAPAGEKAPSREAPEAAAGPAVPPIFVLVAAAVAGFAFLLMELVFYRMLGPILGGSSYTFGLILVFALLGVGLGGAAYPRWAGDRPATVHAFAITCLVEALCLLVPFALGDRIALLALALRTMKGLGFYGLAAGWAAVSAIVVLPAAFVSGVQFPLLMALLGRGRKDVGRHVGLAYAWNTGGSIVGSLAGGFGLMPWLTAPGVWRLASLLLAALGAGAIALSFRIERRRLSLVTPALVGAACVWLALQTGPTAGFRHSPIGAGRVDHIMTNATTNGLREWLNVQRRGITWEADGVESSVALSSRSGYGFIVNGKVDGHVRVDAGTQVMSGLIGAMLHSKPTSAMVVGLGTGSTAGWLGVVPTMERVDVVELEPAILRVARDTSVVNQNVLDNPKVHITIGDAREVLITTKSRYDLIFSEPSNPYRAGIAGLFTREFYQASSRRLAEGGIFLQWLQAYEVDGEAVRTVYATLSSVFPHVETWLTTSNDLILMCSMTPVDYDAATLRQRVTEEPYRTALVNVWRVMDLEGFLAHYVAQGSLARTIFEQDGAFLNTDDRNLLEFSFARTVGKSQTFNDREVFDVAVSRKEDRPLVRGKVDWELVDDHRMAIMFQGGGPPTLLRRYTPDQARRAEAWVAYMRGSFGAFRRVWEGDDKPPRNVTEMEVLAEGYAESANDKALDLVNLLRPLQPVEADAFLARYRLRKGQLPEAGAAALAAIEAYRTSPWPELDVMSKFLDLCAELGARDKAIGRKLFDALATPFAARVVEEERLRARTRLAGRVAFEELCAEAYAAFEPHVPFRIRFLRRRLDCYRATNHPLAAAAERDLVEFLAAEPVSFRAGLYEPDVDEDGDTGGHRPAGAGAPGKPASPGGQ